MTTTLYAARSTLWVPLAGGDSVDPSGGPTPPSDITHGSQINSSNVGPVGGLFPATYSGTIHVNQSWLDSNNGGSSVIQNLEFTATGFNFGADASTITGGAVTFKNCKFNGVGWANGSVWINTALVGSDIPEDFTVYVQNCLCDGLGDVTAEVAETFFTGGQVQLLRTEVTNLCGLTRNYSNNWSVTECFIHNLATVPSGVPHTSCVAVLSGQNISWVRNKCFTTNPSGAENTNNGATGSMVLLSRQQGDTDNITVQDNALQGGGYSMYCGGTGTFAITNAAFTGNVFYRDAWPKAGQFGPQFSFGNVGTETGNVWSNNTWGPIGPHNLGGDPAAGMVITA